MKTTQKAVMMWRKALWTPLVFLSSSICPQMSQRVVILRTIAGHPFQCLLPSQFDDIHLWGRIIAFSTCITVIAPLCTTQSISPEYQNENVVFAASQSYWEFCWKLKQKRIIADIHQAVKNQPVSFSCGLCETPRPVFMALLQLPSPRNQRNIQRLLCVFLNFHVFFTIFWTDYQLRKRSLASSKPKKLCFLVHNLMLTIFVEEVSLKKAL